MVRISNTIRVFSSRYLPALETLLNRAECVSQEYEAKGCHGSRVGLGCTTKIKREQECWSGNGERQPTYYLCHPLHHRSTGTIGSDCLDSWMTRQATFNNSTYNARFAVVLLTRYYLAKGRIERGPA